MGIAVACAVTPVCAPAQETSRPQLLIKGEPLSIPPEQARRLEAIAPTHINRSRPSGSVVSLRAEEIERIDLASVLTPSRSRDGQFDIDQGVLAEELEAAFDRLRPLTLRNRPVELAIRVASVGPVSAPGELFVRLSELVDGIPVDPEGVIHIDAATGRIQSFGLSFTADGVRPPERSLWLSEDEAVAVAQRAVVSERGGPFPISVGATLRFRRQSELELHPEWVVRFGAPTHYEARVDAVTGEARSYSTLVH
jgi:hypothetical protein